MTTGFPSSAAHPVLASTLYDLTSRRQRKYQQAEPDVAPSHACTGIKAIDEIVLNGHFDTYRHRGSIVGLSVERDLETRGTQDWSKTVSGV